jgi:nucleotide-binding universal stress UspA family protein
MKLVIGLDLRPYSQGALHFARWLSVASKRGGEAFVGIHVLEQDHLAAVLRYHHLDEVRDGAVASARAALKATGAEGIVGEPRIVIGTDADEDLTEAVRAEGATALLVGRMAKRGENPVVRLGRVARRLVRGLQVPVIVVPPDLTAQRIGDGPVVALTSMEDDSVAAARFAADLAARLGRKLELLHVMRDLTEFAPYGIVGEKSERGLAEERRAREAALAEWATRHGLTPDASLVLTGEVIDAAIRRAVEVGAPVIVAGARRMPTAQRILLPTVGKELAAASPTAVAIVPA